MKKVIILLSVLLFSLSFKAQLAVTNAAPYNTPTYLVNNILLGNGVTATNITFSGDGNQLGYFSNGLAGAINPLGIDSGIVFSSGDVNDITTGGSTTYGGPGDPDLLTIAQTINAGITSTHDAATLEFDFVPDGDTVEFRFVFASNEYTTYINTVYNDIFSFFISGPGFTGPYASPTGFPNGAQNLAVVPGTATPITISTIHPGLNSQYYINNPSANTFNFNGYTTAISIKFYVTCSALFHFKFSIADCQDGTLDTGVFMEGSSFSSATPTAIQFSTAAIGGDSTIIEGCDGAVLNLIRPSIIGDTTLHFTIGGTATNGVDYTLIADSVSYLTGFDTASIVVTPLTDALIEGRESITITSTNVNACGVTVISADSLYIDDVPFITAVSSDTLLNCPTPNPIPISVSIIGTPPPSTYDYYWTDTQGNTYPNDSIILVPALETDTFYVEVISYCNLITVTDTIIVNVIPLFSLASTQSDTNNCVGDVVNFTTTPSIAGTYTYSWSSTPNIGTINSSTDSTSIGTFNIDGTNQIIVTVDNGGFNCIVKDTMYVNTNLIPIITTTTSDTSICIDGTASLFANFIGTPPVSLIWDNGLVGNGPHQVNPTADTTTYTVYAQDSNLCVSPLQQVIVTLRDSIKINQISLTENTICEGDSTTILVDAIGGGTGLIYTWYNSNNNVIGATDTGAFIITPSFDGEIFSVIVSDSCTTPTKTDDIMTDWADIVLPDYTINNTEGCYDDLLFTPEFENTTPNLGNMVSSTWDFGNGTTYEWPFATPFNYHYDDPGVYDVTLTVTDQAGCIWDTILAAYQVIAYDNPKADFLWNPNPTDYLNAQITFTNQSIDNVFNEWLFITNAQYTSTDIDPVFQFPQDKPGDYDVTLITTNQAGCIDSISKVVIIDDVFLFYIPSAFSPDGDGLNDNFKVVGEGLDLTNFKMTVFNKWGELVFESNNPDIGWDGTRNGSLVPDGVYIWKINAKEAHSPIILNKDGFITIVR